MNSKVDDTRSPGPTFQAGRDENNFGPRWTHFRVLRGLFRVQNGPFMAHLPLEVENLGKGYSEVDDTRSPGTTVQAGQDVNNFGPTWTCLGSSGAYLGSKMGHLWLICP